jgi:hypothetical protein
MNIMDTNAQRKAQQRVDRISALRQELAQLEQEQALVLTPEQQSGLNAHYDHLLADLTQQYDVDVTESGKRVSWGMRITALLGGAAFCAALVLFLHRIWGNLPPSAHVLILSAVPLLLLAAAEIISHFGASLYYTGLLVLAAVLGFVLELNALGNISNLVSSAQALLAWGGFAVLLAHAYGLRLTLGAGLLLLCGYTASLLYTLSGGYWANFFNRPESLLPAAIIVYALPSVAYRQNRNDFGFVFRFCGAACIFIALLFLALDGHTFSGRFPVRTIETLYQFVGLIAGAAVVLHGIRLGRGGMVNLGALAFIIFLYVKLHTWWWAWMPKYLFFLLIGVAALLLLYVFRRLHGRLSERAQA